MPTAAARPPAPRRLTEENPMSPARRADPDLDALIDEITADATTRTSS